MRARVIAELAAAATLAAGALWYVVGGIALGVGTPLHMRAGFFPLCLGLLMTGLSIAIGASALAADDATPQLDLRALGMVLAGFLGFIATLEWVGLVPAVVLLVVLSMLGLPGGSWTERLGAAAAVALLSWLIFRVGIDIPVAAFKSPL